MRYRKAILRSASGLLGIVGVVLGGASAQAGSVTYDFTTDPSAELTIAGNNPNVYHATDGNPGGFLAITHAVDSQNAAVVFPSIDPTGEIVTAFRFEADLRVGNSSDADGRPADGFSISFARAGDPVLTDPGNGGNYAGGLPEAGTTTGIAVGFDTWSGNTLPDGADVEGIIIRVDNVTVLRQAMPTRNGACDDNTSLQTGLWDQAYWTNSTPGDPLSPDSWDTLCWQPLVVELNEQAQLTVSWKGRVLLNNYQTQYFPTQGQLVLAGRTGGNNEHTHIDNISLTTTTIIDNEDPTVPGNLTATFAGARRVELSWDAATDDNARVAYNVYRDGVQLNTGLLVATNYVDQFAEPGTSHNYEVRSVDIAQNQSAAASVAVQTADEEVQLGYLVADIWEGYGAGTMQDSYLNLLSDSDFPNNPDRRIYVPGLNTPSVGDNYMMRVTGTLTVPVTGEYHFFLRSDDQSYFFFNPNGPEIPSPNDFYVAEVGSTCCGPFLEPDILGPDGFSYPTTQTWNNYPVQLVAGQQYGFAAVLHEIGGGDVIQVAMRREGDPTPAANLVPIAGPLVTGMGDPTGASVTITDDLESQTVVENEPVTMTMAATHVSPYGAGITYQWYHNDEIIPGATSPTYTLDVTTAADAGTYKVWVGTLGATEFTSEAELTVETDNILPFVEAIGMSDDSFQALEVTFSEPVTDPTATTAGNYSLSGGATVSSVERVDEYTVRLTTSTLTEDTDYTLTINNVEDNAGNAVEADTAEVFHSWALVPNRAKIFRYNDLAGVDINTLINAPEFPETPDVVGYVNGLVIGDVNGMGETYGENYGAMIEGWIIPKESGDYHFFLRADDQATLYLSSDETLPNPETATAIASEIAGCCGEFQEPGTAQPFETTSTPVSLVAGQRYGVVVLFKEGGGGDWLQVAMRKVGSTLPARALHEASDLVYHYGEVQPAPTLVDVTSPEDEITMVGGSVPASGNESVRYAINDSTAKYLNFGINEEGTTAAPFEGPVGLQVTPVIGSTVVTGLRVYTANDAEVRDPADYVLEGSNDGESFTEISSGPLALPTTRNVSRLSINPNLRAHQEVLFSNSTAYTTYRLTFNNVKDNAAANSVQVAEIELLGSTGTNPETPAISIDADGGTITISYEGTLLSSPTVDGTYSPVEGATSPHTVTPTGEAMFFQARE